MTGYLDAALRRMALPCFVVAYDDGWIKVVDTIWSEPPDEAWGVHCETRDAAEATAAYLALCRELDPTAS